MKIYVLMALMSFSLFAQEEESEALRSMRLSCEKQKVGLGCFNYANMLIRIEKNDMADKYFEIGCKLDHSPSCKKEKWVIPEVVIKKIVPTPDKIKQLENDSSQGVTSAFDIKAPAGYTGSSTAQSSNDTQTANNEPAAFVSATPTFNPPPTNNPDPAMVEPQPESAQPGFVDPMNPI